MTLGQMALAGIVISSGPGDHFETYEVLEATDTEVFWINLKRKPHLLIIMRNMKIPKRHPTFSKLLKITLRPQDKLTPNEILESFLVNALRMFFQRRSLNESENHLKNPEPLPLLNPFSMTLPNRMMPTVINQ